MAEVGKAARVGAMVVATSLLLVLVLRWVDERSSGGATIPVWTLLNDAQGLVKKSRVLTAGIEVGYIDQIELFQGKARVDIRIHADAPIYKNARVFKRTASVLGEALLVIEPGDDSARRVRSGDQLQMGHESATTDSLLNSMGQVLESVRKVTTQLERSFGTDEAGEQMRHALESLTEALDSANRLIQTNEQLVGQSIGNIAAITEDLRPQLAAIMSDVRSISGALRTAMAEPGGAGGAPGTEAGRVVQTFESLNRSAQELEKIMGDLRTTSDRLAQGKGTIGRLTSDEALADELHSTVEGVSDFVGGYARLQTIVTLRSEYNFLANTFKNYVRLRLQPREDRFFEFDIVDDPRGVTDITETTVTTSPPPDGVPHFYQERRVETRDKFRFSLLFGKRVAFTTFRFGIIESTGGVGMDIHLFDDEFEIQTDVFSIDEQTYPRVRMRLAYEMFQRLWLLGGVDDILNSGTRDYFLGAQLRFNDEDLKNLLPFSSGISGAGRQ